MAKVVAKGKRRWPATSELRDWLVRTAEWAADIRRCDRDRCFGEFALGELLARGFHDDAARVVTRMMEQRCTADTLHRWTEDEVLLDAVVTLGRPDDARAILRDLLPFVRAEKRPCDMDFLPDRMFAWLTASGVEVGPRPRLRKKRFERLDALLAGPLDLRAKARQAQEGSGSSPRDPATLAAEVRGGLRSLGPDQMNVHFAIRPLRRAVAALIERGDHDQAIALVDEAEARRAEGLLDGRGFASGAAYVELARAEVLVGRAARARILVDAACKMGPKSVVLPDAAVAYAELGDVDRALACARAAGPGRAEALTAEILLSRGEHARLGAHLGRITEPKAAARTSWALVRLLIDGELG